jgi:hypothetical protein
MYSVGGRDGIVIPSRKPHINLSRDQVVWTLTPGRSRRAGECGGSININVADLKRSPDSDLQQAGP